MNSKTKESNLGCQLGGNWKNFSIVDSQCKQRHMGKLLKQ